MLNRMSLSIKNSWYDEQGRVYIYCTAEETREDLRCGNDKGAETAGRAGCEERLWADRAYQAEAREADQEIRIKHFTTRTVPEPSAQPELRGADLDLSGFQTSEKPISEPRQIRGLDLENQIHLLSVIGSEIVLLTVYNRLDVAIIAALAGTNFEYNFDNLFENLISPATGT